MTKELPASQVEPADRERAAEYGEFADIPQHKCRDTQAINESADTSAGANTNS